MTDWPIDAPLANAKVELHQREEVWAEGGALLSVSSNLHMGPAPQGLVEISNAERVWRRILLHEHVHGSAWSG